MRLPLTSKWKRSSSRVAICSGKQLDARCGQLDRQGNAVQARTDAGDGGCICFRRLEPWVGLAGALQEELGRLGFRQRGEAIRNFSGDLQGLAAAGDDLEPGAVVQEIIGQASAGIYQMFAVVEDQQGVFLAQVIHYQRSQRVGRLLLQAKYLRHDRGDLGWVGQSFQLDEPDAVRKVGQRLRANLLGKAGFAGAARACQRDEPD